MPPADVSDTKYQKVGQLATQPSHSRLQSLRLLSEALPRLARRVLVTLLCARCSCEISTAAPLALSSLPWIKQRTSSVPSSISKGARRSGRPALSFWLSPSQGLCLLARPLCPARLTGKSASAGHQICGAGNHQSSMSHAPAHRAVQGGERDALRMSLSGSRLHVSHTSFFALALPWCLFSW